jgi:NitT/TauT family transport system substrate-binding protein
MRMDTTTRSGSTWRRAARSGAALTVGAVMLSTLAACGSDDDGGSSDASSGSDGELASIRLGVTPTTAWLPAMVADAEGFFDENGLDVEITKVQQSPSAAIGQQFDIGQATGTDFVQAINGGLDQVLISSVAQEVEETTGLMVPAGSDIKSVEDLAGTRVAIATRSSVIAESLVFLLNEAGVNESEVTMQEAPFPTHSDQLAGGQVDASAAPAPFTGQMAAAGATSVLNPIIEAGSAVSDGTDLITVFGATTREWAESHPKEIEAWRAALTQAVEFIENNEDEARTILQEFTGLPAPVVAATPLYTFQGDATTPEEIGVWIDVLKGSGTLPKDADLKPEDLVVE